MKGVFTTETYFIYKNGKQIDEVFETVDGTMMDVLRKWLNENGYKGIYNISDETEDRECCVEINDDISITIRYGNSSI